MVFFNKELQWSLKGIGGSWPSHGNAGHNLRTLGRQTTSKVEAVVTSTVRLKLRT